MFANRLPALFGLLALLAPMTARAQTLEMTPTPFTALVDFATLRRPAGQALEAMRSQPIWLEGVQRVEPGEAATTTGEKERGTVFRIRLRPMPGLNDRLLLRLYFEDKPGAHPLVTGWSETGGQRYASPPLGAGLGLPASQSLLIPMRGIDYLEIAVPGDGSTLRQALLTSIHKAKTAAAYDFALAPALLDPFGGGESLPAPERDTFLFGRTRATLEAGTVHLSAPDAPKEETSTLYFEFNLESAPLLAMLTFDVLAAYPAAPLLAWANNEPVGSVSMLLPDLADPGYTGATRPLEGMRFRYAGWARCQKVIPARCLHPGKNVLALQLPPHSTAVALRKIELQLKNPWQKLDYTLIPF